MLIMGVDPGSSATGYGVIEKIGVRSTHVTSGAIKVARLGDLSKRLREIYLRLDEVIRAHRPDVLVVESLFHARSAQSLMKLCQVRGVILLLGEMHAMDIFEYAPAAIKTGLTGYGRAEKDQMVFMVSRILSLPELKSPDQADALAMALYHSHISLPSRAVS